MPVAALTAILTGRDTKGIMSCHEEEGAHQPPIDQGTAPAHPGSQWTPVASSSLNVARASHAGAEINNSIFVLGGWPDRQFTRALTEVERLDKIGAPWQLLPPLNAGRGNPAAAALDGRLYAIGGYDQAGNALTSVEAIEPGRTRPGPPWRTCPSHVARAPQRQPGPHLRDRRR